MDQAEKFKKVIDAITNIRDSRGVQVKGGKTYTQVSDRVEQFRRTFTDEYSIVTDVLAGLNQDNDGDEVVVKATILDQSGRPVATGHASEIRGDGRVNETSALENAETGAIGRALAALGFHGGEFASANELDAVERKTETKKRVRKEVPAGEPMSASTPESAAPDMPAIQVPDGELSADQQDQIVAFIGGLIDQFGNTARSLSQLWTQNTATMEQLQTRCPELYSRVLKLFGAKKDQLKKAKTSD